MAASAYPQITGLVFVEALRRAYPAFPVIQPFADYILRRFSNLEDVSACRRPHGLLEHCALLFPALLFWIP